MGCVGNLYYIGFLKGDHHLCNHQCKEVMKMITDGEEEEATRSTVWRYTDDGLTVVRLTSDIDEKFD